MTTKPQKIAVLGGGISALSAVFDLTSDPNWQTKYDITVFQLGWRIGGKGASSRNPAFDNRIEEHGLHIWLGFYENAFRMIRECYGELPPGSPCFASWQDAFKPHDFVVLQEHIEGKWISWPTDFPTNPALPGDGQETPSVWDYFVMLLEWLDRSFNSSRLAQVQTPAPTYSSLSAAAMQRHLRKREHDRLPHGAKLLRTAHRKARRLPRHARFHSKHDHNVLWFLLEDFSSWLHREVTPLLDQDTELRRLYIPIDLFCAVAKGILNDGSALSGFDSLDVVEFRTWLQRHGASSVALESAWMRGAYDLGFSFENGDKKKPNIAAGVAVRAALRMVFTYKGSILWKMQAGMGETVFTPIYLVLKNRGVKFKFFHRVDKLRISPDQRLISEIEINRQATLKKTDYEPLISVGPLACWRHQPDFDQLVEGAELNEKAINLESYWTPWTGAEQLVLRHGIDYDVAILGIPISALRTICSDLADTVPAWQMMLQGIKAIQTQGFQIWLNKTLKECGWNLPSPILGAYVEPLDTWADMSHLLKLEGWSANGGPTQLAYFCGVLQDDDVIPPSSDHGFPALKQEEAARTAIAFLREHLAYLWPRAVEGENGTAFDWNLLFCRENSAGDQRFYSQYWRPNIDPSERYTLAVAGSTAFRLRASESGFSNLILAGDWIRNGFNSPGCIESSVISGKQAARAISGGTKPIIGESDFQNENTILAAVLRFLWNFYAFVRELLGLDNYGKFESPPGPKIN